MDKRSRLFKLPCFTILSELLSVLRLLPSIDIDGAVDRPMPSDLDVSSIRCGPYGPSWQSCRLQRHLGSSELLPLSLSPALLSLHTVRIEHHSTESVSFLSRVN